MNVCYHFVPQREMELSLVSIYELSKDKHKLIQHLRLWKLIPLEGEYVCPKCHGILHLCEDACSIDGFRWHCHNKVKKEDSHKRQSCGTYVELRENTFFSRCNLPIYKILGFINLWVDNISLSIISKQLEIDLTTAIEWASCCREVILNAYILNKKMLGGRGKIVDIYESRFCNRKYHRGVAIEGKYVFGGYERGTGRIFMLCVEEQGIATMIPVIKDWIQEGTTLVSDYWKASNCSTSAGYQILKCNLDLCFKEPGTVSQANSLKSTCRAMKSSMTPERWKKTIPGDLACFLFQKRCKELKLDCMNEFLTLLAQLYNPMIPLEPVDEALDLDGLTDIE